MENRKNLGLSSVVCVWLVVRCYLGQKIDYGIERSREIDLCGSGFVIIVFKLSGHPSPQVVVL